MATAPKAKAKTKAKSYPFPYYGEGSAQPIREKDGLMILVVFAKEISRSDAKAIAASAPAPLRSGSNPGSSWLVLDTNDIVSRKAYTQLEGALSPWIREVHRAHPVALFFVGSDGKRGPWHADTIKRFGEVVRPVIDRLRRARATDHADWIAASFLRSGAKGSFDDVRVMAEEDGPELGNVAQRCRLVMPLVDALGPSAVSALGPYGELGFWASASTSELVPDPKAHAERLVALADACPKKRIPAVRLALVLAACILMRDSFRLAVRVERPKRTPQLRPESFDAAFTLATKAASCGPLTIGMLEMLIDDARALGGKSRAVAMAKPFLRSTLAATNPTPRTHADEANLACAFATTAALAKDLLAAPDAELAAVLAAAPKPESKELPVKGATHPHLARLNPERLTVRYRGSLEAQLVTIEIKGSSRTELARHYAQNVEHVVDMIEAGLAGATSFAPELGEAKIVKAPKASNDGPDFAWTLKVRAVDPCFWAVALDLLANPSERWNGLPDVNDCPKHVSIVGSLALDASPASAKTEDVIAWLRNPAPAFRAWPEPPFEVSEKAAKSQAFSLKPKKMSKALNENLQSCSYDLVRMLEAHPKAGKNNSTSSVVPSKTQVKVPWYKLSCPVAVARGPILNLARRLHFRVTPLLAVELAMG